MRRSRIPLGKRQCNWLLPCLRGHNNCCKAEGHRGDHLIYSGHGKGDGDWKPGPQLAYPVTVVAKVIWRGGVPSGR